MKLANHLKIALSVLIILFLVSSVYPEGNPGMYRNASMDSPPIISASGDEYWDTQFVKPGVNGEVYAMTVDGGNLYIGGEIWEVDGNTMDIAMWNGTQWISIGQTNGQVNAMAVSGGSLYVGGDFTNVNGVGASNIARWDGSNWHAVGSGTDGEVNAIALDGTDVYVGGNFTHASGTLVNRIAKWNGSSWSSLGTGANGTVLTIAVDGGDVYAGGEFEYAGGILCRHIARWNGSSWSSLSGGLFEDRVHCITIHGSDIYAGTANMSVYWSGLIYKWNGSSWSTVGGAIKGQVLAISFIGSALYAGGNFYQAGSELVNDVAKWDGSNWSSLDGGVENNSKKVHVGEGQDIVYSLAVIGTNLYVGGFFSDAGDVDANSIARWDGSDWWPLSAAHGMGHFVFTSTTGVTDIYAGGRFVSAGGLVVNHVARWTGSAWVALGDGLNGDVYAVALGNDGLYAGGRFDHAGGISASNIARWDGTNWHALGSGISGGSSPCVYAIAVDGSDVYVGGRFTSAGGSTANYIAKWNGTSWSTLGSGMDEQVRALLVNSGNVYAGGYFTSAGGVSASLIARWDGTWHAMGSGVSGQKGNELISDLYHGPFVADIEAIGSDIYAGGYFASAGAINLNNIARWNGSSWFDVGGGVEGYRHDMDFADDEWGFIRDMAVIGTDLYVGGWFQTAGGISANRIAKWNGSTWSPMGSGLGGTVPNGTSYYNGSAYTISAIGNELYVGGEFRSAGGNPSYYFAHWGTSVTPPSPVPDFTGFTRITSGPVVTDGGSSMGCAWGDYNGDGLPDLFIANDDGENNFLYMNSGGGAFTKVSTGPVVTDGGRSFAGSWGDYDNDGDLDLYVANIAGEANFLYTNNGSGTFTKVTSGDIVTDTDRSNGCAWADYDNDGNLDLFVANNAGDDNRLYRNNGDGTFTKITSGDVVNDGGNSVTGGWCDYDLDGDMDLFVANNGGENNFLYSNNGDGTFTKETSSVVAGDGGESWSVSWGDYNNDGFPDLFVGNNFEQNFLYQNNGDGTFTKVSSGEVVTGNDHTRGSSWGDINRDGYLDLFASNRQEDGYVYMNNGNGTFTKYKTDVVDSRGCAFADYDGDGDPDLCAVDNGANNVLYENTSGGSNHWLSVRCIGTVSNTSALGARIYSKATPGGSPMKQTRQILGQTGFGGQNRLEAEFGLGNAVIVDSIKIYWPSGIYWDTTNVAADQMLTITEKPSAPNLPPVAVIDSVITYVNTNLVIYVIDNDSDPDGDDVFIAFIDQSQTLGTATIMPGDTTIMYETPADQTGWDDFSYTITDGKGGYDSAIVHVEILPINENPIAVSDTIAIQQDSTVIIYPIVNDSDPEGDALSIAGVLMDGTSGTAAINPGDTSVTYTPPAGYSGNDAFDYILSDGNGGLDTATVVIDITPVSGISDRAVPSSYALFQNYPNPFNPVTTISYELPEKSVVSLKIFSVTGSEILTMVNEEKSAGHYEAVWHACDKYGRPVGSGIYFYQLKAGDYKKIRKMLLVR